MSFWKRAETELDREIEHHLHHLAAEYERQGYSRQEALRMARREFGGREQVKEQCRDQRRWAWFTGVWQDVVFGIRMMRRAPVMTTAAVLSLALGIGANAAIGSLMDIVLWRDLPVPNPKQLTLVHWKGQSFREIAEGTSGSMTREGVADFFSYPAYLEMRRSLGSKAQLAAYIYPHRVSVSYASRPVVAQQRGVGGNFFSTLQLRPLFGRLLSEDDDQPGAAPVLVVSHRFWARTLNADADAVGRTISINSQPFEIAGVLPPDFYGLFPNDGTEIYIPLHQSSGFEGMRRNPFEDNRSWVFQLIARRAPDVEQSQILPILATVFPATWWRQPKEMDKAPHILLRDGAQGLGSLRSEFRDPLFVLAGLVALLLAIACTNIANLLLARATARQKEVATRVSLGCSRARLMRQFLTESALMAVLGGAVSLVVAYLTANLMGQFVAGRDRFPIAVALNFRILGMVGVATMAALVLFGLWPAWRGSRVDSAGFLKAGSGVLGGSRRKWGTGRALVLAQMAMSVVLVMAAVVFTRNLANIQSGDPGFDRRNMILFGIRPGTSGYDKAKLGPFYFHLEQRLAETPGVAAVGLAGMRPMNIGGRWDNVRLAGHTEAPNASINIVTPGYVSLYVSGLVAGRNISQADIASNAKVAVISEDLARKLGGNVLGGRIQFPDRPPGVAIPEYEIIGIAPPFAATSMKVRPYTVWLPLDREGQEVTVVLRTSQSPNAVLPAIRQTMSEIDRDLPLVDLVTMEEQISKGLQRERMFATLCSGFGVLALVLSVVGLYGVIAYNTSRRRSEIGVRLALGALPKDILSLVMRDGLVLAVLGILLGLPIVFLGAKYLEKELFQMKPLEPESATLALGILFCCALIAVGIPALRASALQPSETLRQE